MKQNSITIQVKAIENDFLHFMNYSNLPNYHLESKEVSLAVAENQGFEVVASASYQCDSNKHNLVFSTNLEIPKYLIFHEFTHMMDSEMYAKSDKYRYAGISGYTEYHASQVELMQMVGAPTFDQHISFSMSTSIDTLSGVKSVSQYISEKQQHAIALFSRPDFPADIHTLKSALGILFNYWGLRSICRLYAKDYCEHIDNSAFLNFIPHEDFNYLDTMMSGFPNSIVVNLSIKLYAKTIISLAQKYHLI